MCRRYGFVLPVEFPIDKRIQQCDDATHPNTLPHTAMSIHLQVPLNEKKTQRTILLPDRLWEFAKLMSLEDSYTLGVRIILETAYQKTNSKDNK